MDNKTAYALLLAVTISIYGATGRDWASLSETEQGERINAVRNGFRIVLNEYQSKGYGLRTSFMAAIVNATAAPKELTPETAVEKALAFFAAMANGSRVTMSVDEAKLITAGLDKVELAG